MKKGDVAGASKLINQASEEIAAVVNTGNAVDLKEVNRLKYDPHSGKNKLAEGSAATELQNIMGGRLERVDSDISGADFIFTSGPNKGKTVDFMFTTAKGAEKEIEGMNKFFNNNWDRNMEQLHAHISKSDIVPLDFRNLSTENQLRLISYINMLPPVDRAKIVIVR
ncbi:PilZ domain-containing protein [Serratia microhaemolytica]|uniref:PilZ domain-containing protein n=1 Tax=Serratia microhaemolytica TaxID=2675110 RepID=UPI000FDDCAC5|nr:PilZ domain-containing protein [Serratia microhaemolytica]